MTGWTGIPVSAFCPQGTGYAVVGGFVKVGGLVSGQWPVGAGGGWWCLTVGGGALTGLAARCRRDAGRCEGEIMEDVAADIHRARSERRDRETRG